MAQFQQLSAEVAALRQARTYAQAVQQPTPERPVVAGTIVPPAPIVQIPLPGASKAGGSKDPTPKMGESGSGYTRLANGKFVKNRRPKARPIQDRQSKNWRAKSTTALVQFLKLRGIGKNDPKPVDDATYQALVSDLEMSKLYSEYLKNEDEPLEVHEWRQSLVDDDVIASGNFPGHERQGNLPTDPSSLDRTSHATPQNIGPAPMAPLVDDQPKKYKVFYDLSLGTSVNTDSVRPYKWVVGYNLPAHVEPNVLADEKAFRAFAEKYSAPPSTSWADEVEESDLDKALVPSDIVGSSGKTDNSDRQIADANLGLITQGVANSSLE